jgi:SAM-dependent methyltransferase
LEENRQFYQKRFLGAHYARQSGLRVDEAAILQRHGNNVLGTRILDLGVGGGRTTPFLLELSPDYIGVDYSPEMVVRCRERFPATRFEIHDARDLSAFPDAHFGFVLFSNNGIDSVGHQDRLHVLSEVRRVLSAKGLFVFSSHNRMFEIPKPWDPRHLAINPVRSPVRFAKRAASYPAGIFNYLRRAHRSESRREYSISIDSAYRYSLVHYRIGPSAQTEQLTRAGFRDIEVVGADGRLVSSQEPPTSEDPWFHYVCRKA